MDLQHYFAIVRRHWLLVVAVPLLVALLSLAVAATRPPRYGLTVRMLVTRADLGNQPDPAGVGTIDTVAYDLPAIMNGAPFRQDVVDQLAKLGIHMTQNEVAHSLALTNENRVVVISVLTSDPQLALTIADIVVNLVQTHGLRYWGIETATPERPGINIAMLEFPSEPHLINTAGTVAVQIALRTVAGLIAGIGLAFVMHYLTAGASARAGLRVEAGDGPELKVGSGDRAVR